MRLRRRWFEQSFAATLQLLKPGLNLRCSWPGSSHPIEHKSLAGDPDKLCPCYKTAYRILRQLVKALAHSLYARGMKPLREKLNGSRLSSIAPTGLLALFGWRFPGFRSPTANFILGYFPASLRDA